MSSFHRILATTALLVGTSVAAHAVELFTPVSTGPNGSQLRCHIVNVGTKPIEVSANFEVASTTTDCPVSRATLAPGAYCSTVVLGSILREGYCHFTATSSKVRAALLVVNDVNGETLIALPATK